MPGGPSDCCCCCAALIDTSRDIRLLTGRACSSNIAGCCCCCCSGTAVLRPLVLAEAGASASLGRALTAASALAALPRTRCKTMHAVMVANMMTMGYAARECLHANSCRAPAAHSQKYRGSHIKCDWHITGCTQDRCTCSMPPSIIHACIRLGRGRSSCLGRVPAYVAGEARTGHTALTLTASAPLLTRAARPSICRKVLVCSGSRPATICSL